MSMPIYFTASPTALGILLVSSFVLFFLIWQAKTTTTTKTGISSWWLFKVSKHVFFVVFVMSIFQTISGKKWIEAACSRKCLYWKATCSNLTGIISITETRVNVTNNSNFLICFLLCGGFRLTNWMLEVSSSLPSSWAESTRLCLLMMPVVSQSLGSTAALGFTSMASCSRAS